MDQVQDVAVAIGEKYQPVALIHIRLGQKMDAALAKRAQGRVEIVDADGKMTDAWILHLLRTPFAFRWDDLQHGSVRRAHKIIAIVNVIDPKAKVMDVPLG